MKGILVQSTLAYTILLVTNAFATERFCQTDRKVRTLLKDALTLSTEMARQSTVLSKEMSIKWPASPDEESSIDFFLRVENYNKTEEMPLRILKTNCRILRTFIALLLNSTNQLRSFQVSEGLKSQLVQLKIQTRTLLDCLRRIVEIIKSNQQGQRGAKNRGDREDQDIIVSSNTGSASTIEDAALRTKLILDELTTNAFNLIQDLWKIQTCN